MKSILSSRWREWASAGGGNTGFKQWAADNVTFDTVIAGFLPLTVIDPFSDPDLPNVPSSVLFTHPSAPGVLFKKVTSQTDLMNNCQGVVFAKGGLIGAVVGAEADDLVMNGMLHVRKLGLATVTGAGRIYDTGVVAPSGSTNISSHYGSPVTADFISSLNALHGDVVTPAAWSVLGTTADREVFDLSVPSAAALACMGVITYADAGLLLLSVNTATVPASQTYRGYLAMPLTIGKLSTVYASQLERMVIDAPSTTREFLQKAIELELAGRLDEPVEVPIGVTFSTLPADAIRVGVIAPRADSIVNAGTSFGAGTAWSGATTARRNVGAVRTNLGDQFDEYVFARCCVAASISTGNLMRPRGLPIKSTRQAHDVLAAARAIATVVVKSKESGAYAAECLAAGVDADVGGTPTRIPTASSVRTGSYGPNALLNDVLVGATTKQVIMMFNRIYRRAEKLARAS